MHECLIFYRLPEGLVQLLVVGMPSRVTLFTALPPGYIRSLPCPCVLSVSFRLSCKLTLIGIGK